MMIYYRGDHLGGLCGFRYTLGMSMGVCYCKKDDTVWFRCSGCTVATSPWTATCSILAADPLPSLQDEVRQTVRVTDRVHLT
jgi:hypothetical protein